MTASDLIAAVATPLGEGGIGVVRVSGDHPEVLLPMLSLSGLPPPRRATVCRFTDAAGETIDEGLVVHFPAPHSFTGEAVLELHAHGGAVVLQRLLDRCLELGGRVATAGEFTLRAYLNNKLDLLQAEAVADLISAHSAAAARAAAASLTGEFSRRVNQFGERLRQFRANLEGGLDFSDDDAGVPTPEAVVAETGRLADGLQQLLDCARQGAILTRGVEVVILGAPNVGKSSLFNRLAGEPAAIVNETPGTTRDIIERTIDLGGVGLRLADGAGIRGSDDAIEREGMERINERLQRATLILSLFTADIPAVPIRHGTPALLVENKIDLTTRPAGIREGVVALSAKTGEGVDGLVGMMRSTIGLGAAEVPFSARQRHLNLLRRALDFVRRAGDDAASPELAAAWLREAQTPLTEMLGVCDEETLLGDIFSRFCVGK